MTACVAVLWLALASGATDMREAPPSETKQDASRAPVDIDALLRRASMGDASAQRLLGDAYAGGEGVAKDLEEAIQWYRSAAEQGDYQAQVRLAETLRARHKGKNEKIEALMWLMIAANMAPRQEHERIAQHQQSMAHDMKPKESSEAAARAEAWLEEFKRQAATPAPSTPRAFQLGNGVTAPQVLRQVRPAYTQAAMLKKIQGKVTVTGVVLVDGSLAYLRIVRSLDRRYGLDQEAVKAARQWRFAPGTKDGVAVPVQISIELYFTLR